METLRKSAEIFQDMLPASLGEPIILSTKSEPIVFVAFYKPKFHDLGSANQLLGAEFRLWHVKAGFRKNNTLAGVAGIKEGVDEKIICALVEHGTRKKMLAPYAKMIFAMIESLADDQAEHI
jgi:hypothetical protein